MSRVVRRLLHVSDLHIGDVDPLHNDAQFDAQAFAWWQLSSIFDGYLGHTHVALVRLEDLVDKLRAEGPTDLVVTGDLTTTGAKTQLDTAMLYIRDEVPVRRGTPVGLSEADATVIPGNHDHWPGRVCHATQFFWCMCGVTGAHVATTFPGLPTTRNVPLIPGCNLVLASINSDAQVGLVDRVAARGSFVRQCVALAADLGKPAADELRVLLVHHSYIKGGFALAMDARSKEALEALIETAGIRLILTGHAHTAKIRDVTTPTSFRELRCGTTTARDHYPKKRRWLMARLRRWRRLPKNTALVHEISENGGVIYWTTKVMRRNDRAAPFTESSVEPPIRVWP